MDFISRAATTPLEHDYDLLFNLYLVKRRARPATLVEMQNDNRSLWWDNTQEYYRQVKKVYPEFVYQISLKAHGQISWFFVSLRALPKRRKNEDMDKWTGRVLGFDCMGIPVDHDAKICGSLSYRVVLPRQPTILKHRKSKVSHAKSEADKDTDPLEVHFYAERYPAEQPSRSKLKAFRSCAAELGWDVVEERREDVPDQMLIEAFFNGGALNGDPNWLNARAADFDNLLWNHTRVDTGKELPLDKLIGGAQGKKSPLPWACFVLAKSRVNPLWIFWPLSGSLDSLSSKVEVSLFKKLRHDPKAAFEQYIAEVFGKKVKELSRKRLQMFNDLKTGLFALYDEYMQRISENGVHGKAKKRIIAKEDNGRQDKAKKRRIK